MKINTYDNSEDMSLAAAAAGADLICKTIERKGECNIIVATGASQLGMLRSLATANDIDWSRVTGFHLDEYLGLPLPHPASFRLYLWKQFVSRLPLPMKNFYFLDGEDDPDTVCRQAGDRIREKPIDVAFVGIGENGHLAFNDPPADFTTTEPYLVVALDDACRQQQVGEGWFNTLDDVPTRAISMSVQQILASQHIICTVPDERKAVATAATVNGPVSPKVPASILQEHASTTLFLDAAAASRLEVRSS